MQLIAIFFILIFAGILLISAETIIPGGILGFLGAGLLVTATVIGWVHFPAPYNLASVAGVICVAFLLIASWLSILPKNSEDEEPSDPEIDAGTLCKTISTLRPTGQVLIDGNRIDVITEGETIDAHVQVEVIRTEGTRIFVRENNDQK